VGDRPGADHRPRRQDLRFPGSAITPRHQSRRADQWLRPAHPEPRGRPAAVRLDRHRLRSHGNQRRLPAVAAVSHRPGPPVS
jgi:hypothetical protein